MRDRQLTEAELQNPRRVRAWCLHTILGCIQPADGKPVTFSQARALRHVLVLAASSGEFAEKMRACRIVVDESRNRPPGEPGAAVHLFAMRVLERVQGVSFNCKVRNEQGVGDVRERDGGREAGPGAGLAGDGVEGG